MQDGAFILPLGLNYSFPEMPTAAHPPNVYSQLFEHLLGAGTGLGSHKGTLN